MLRADPEEEQPFPDLLRQQPGRHAGQRFLLHDGIPSKEWPAQFTDDTEYRVPVRITRRIGHPDVVDDIFRFDENKLSLGLRVRRLGTNVAWAEDPPSFTRRFVTNVKVAWGECENEFAVRSYLPLHRSRGDRGRNRQAYGNCMLTAPDVFDLDDEAGVAIIPQERPPLPAGRGHRDPPRLGGITLTARARGRTARRAGGRGGPRPRPRRGSSPRGTGAGAGFLVRPRPRGEGGRRRP
ncbi:aromatic-ring-hydroxylating dioxygenase subunit beta [Nonomuraea sp. B12E4]|uniref:aromatic-ring-hydroxylating dioxygenase subunit beta n=1 Tax=Nonomuraea sp. B12E4 TaxID=3153564 RepID=UPI00325E48B0